MIIDFNKTYSLHTDKLCEICGKETRFSQLEVAGARQVRDCWNCGYCCDLINFKIKSVSYSYNEYYSVQVSKDGVYLRNVLIENDDTKIHDFVEKIVLEELFKLVNKLLLLK